MHWRFWEPRHTVGAIAERLATGLREGGVVLDEPFDEDDGQVMGEIVVELDLRQGMSDAEILELVKRCSMEADEKDRRAGGAGLRLNKIMIKHPSLRVAFRPKEPTAAQ